MSDESTRVTEAFGRRCIPKIFEAIEDGRPDEKVSNALRLLIERMHAPVAKEEAIMGGNMDSLVQTLATGDDDIVGFACVTIQSMCDSLNGRTKLIEAGAILQLTLALQRAPLEASSALERLLDSKDGKESFVPHAVKVIDVIQELVAVTQDPTVKMHCINILTCAAETEEGLQILLTSGIPEMVLSVVQGPSPKCSPNQEALDYACAGFFRATTTTPSGRTNVREHDGIIALSTLLSKGGVLTKTRVTAALMNLSIDVPSKQLIVQHCLDNLIQFLSEDQNSALFQNTRAALLNCSEDRIASLKIQTALTPTQIEQKLGPLPQFAPRL